MIASLIFTIALSLIFSYKNYNKDISEVKNNLAIYVKLYNDSFSLDEEGAIEFSNLLEGVEVTFLSLEGVVIGSSNPKITG